MNRARNRLSADLAWASLGALLAAIAFVTVSPKNLVPAANALPASCLDAHTGSDDDYGQWQVEEADGSTANDLRGIMSDVHFPDTYPDCQRISSLYVFSPTRNGFFEFGIVLGWSTCNGGYYTGNVVFSAWKPNGSGGDCQVWGGSGFSGGTHTLRASDVNANTVWGGFFDGKALQPDGVNLDFARGYGGVNVERGSPDDASYAEFQQINEYHDGNGWTYTDDLAHKVDIGPDYHSEIDTNEHHVTVVHN